MTWKINFSISTLSCASWSPNGEQIVIGFLCGKLGQFDQNLKLIKVISCVLPSPTSPIIGIQWLSSFQFAVAFSEELNEPQPLLGTLARPEKRRSPVFMQNILPWCGLNNFYILALILYIIYD